MPVIHCLGSFLGMTASSLSVSILMARSSSVTRAHPAPSSGWAAVEPAPASAMSKPQGIEAMKILESRMHLPRGAFEKYGITSTDEPSIGVQRTHWNRAAGETQGGSGPAGDLRRRFQSL